MAIEFKDYRNCVFRKGAADENGNDLAIVDIELMKYTTLNYLSVDEHEQILSEMKALQSEVVK